MKVPPHFSTAFVLVYLSKSHLSRLHMYATEIMSGLIMAIYYSEGH